MSTIIRVQLKQPERHQEFIARACFDLYPYTDNSSLAINNNVTKQELDSLFSTQKYERPYQPEYYNPLEEYIGELWTDETEHAATQVVVDKINQFIPYLSIDTSRTTYTYQNYKLGMELVFNYQYDFSRTLYKYERTFDTVT